MNCEEFLKLTGLLNHVRYGMGQLLNLSIVHAPNHITKLVDFALCRHVIVFTDRNRVYFTSSAWRVISNAGFSLSSDFGEAPTVC